MTIAPGPFADLVGTHRAAIREVLIVSDVRVGDPSGPGVYESAAYPGLRVKVEKAPWGKCERCWNHAPESGRSTDAGPCGVRRAVGNDVPR